MADSEQGIRQGRKGAWKGCEVEVKRCVDDSLLKKNPNKTNIQADLRESFIIIKHLLVQKAEQFC